MTNSLTRCPGAARRMLVWPPMDSVARLLIVAGLVLLGAGLLLVFASHGAPHVPWLGRLPGDIRIERPGFRFYAPLTTSIIISVVLSLLLWLVGRWR